MKTQTLLPVLVCLMLALGCTPAENAGFLWLRTAKDVKLPLDTEAEIIPGDPQGDFIEVTQSPAGSVYRWLTCSETGECMEEEFALAQLREMIHKSNTLHQLKRLTTPGVVIAADQDLPFRAVSDLITAFQVIHVNRFRFQVAAKTSEQQVAFQTIMIGPLNDEYFRQRFGEGAIPLAPGPLIPLDNPATESITDLEIPPPPIEFKNVFLDSSSVENYGLLRLNLDAGGQVAFPAKTVALTQLLPELQPILKTTQTETIIWLTTDPQAPWADVIQYLRAIRLAKVKRFAFLPLEHLEYEKTL
ncbi:MAG: hypothetical protein H6581_06575 [Bacteroidia bacterium]|nr:hypothetical protein [Bacteroidia bacterium]